ncbi:hypothetical protein Alches_02590 [Alicyclobacillus hesperidum subsp. aegles]|uniref:hypothetical protein n=1 Tax=Alicyclobacillus hesperidum TaxID=89784 RepID=UPI0012EE796E|nr:hypothetical protein [Alicyclobacillus hesperidum]GLG00220.1 hypothetical protein Alches_02590 [Alicyclobacillus hesperidum subsp. aegles]
MEIYIPNLKTEIDLSVSFSTNFPIKEVRDGIPTDRINIYQVKPSKTFQYYSIGLNGKFRVCGVRTDETSLLKNGIYGTLSVLEDVSDLITMRSVLCSRVNDQGIAEELTSIFTDENPLVILSFELISPSLLRGAGA